MSDLPTRGDAALELYGVRLSAACRRARSPGDASDGDTKACKPCRAEWPDQGARGAAGYAGMWQMRPGRAARCCRRARAAAPPRTSTSSACTSGSPRSARGRAARTAQRTATCASRGAHAWALSCRAASCRVASEADFYPACACRTHGRCAVALRPVVLRRRLCTSHPLFSVIMPLAVTRSLWTANSYAGLARQ